VGIIIGAGIYVLLGAATAEAGPLVWLAFLGAAVLSALTGLSYAELSSMFPSAAGEYEYTRHAMPEWLAFVVGWTMIVGLVVAAATVSIGFARYVGYFVDRRTRTCRGRSPPPGAIRGVPVLPVLGLASVALMMTQLEPLAIAVGTAACAIGLAVGWLVKSRRYRT